MDLLERGIFGFVHRVPGWVVGLVALLLYGVGLILPPILNWSLAWLVIANITGTAWAAVLGIGWLWVQIEARDRRHLMEWTSDLRHLSAVEFEWLVGELFRRETWEVRETGRQDGPDGNIDLELTGKNGRTIVQCKRWDSREVGVDEVREFAGTLMREGLHGSDGIFVTLSKFNRPALAEAKRIGLNLIDRYDLYERVKKVRRTEPCPICTTPMVFGHSRYGWWFHCEVAGCRGKKNLSDEVGRAVEILTLAA